jgi:hypothetical protein
MPKIVLNPRSDGMKNNTQFVNGSVDVQNVFREILLIVGKKILNDINGENISFADLNAVATILQKLVTCYAELKPFSDGDPPNSSRIISQEVLDTIQTQLNLL